MFSGVKDQLIGFFEVTRAVERQLFNGMFLILATFG